MSTLILRLDASRPTFAIDMTPEEQEIMGRHAAHWQPFIASGQMVVFGPVLHDSGSWGLGVLETEDEDAIHAHAAADPAVTSGVGRLEVGKLLAGFVRPGGRAEPPSRRSPITAGASSAARGWSASSSSRTTRYPDWYPETTKPAI